MHLPRRRMPFALVIVLLASLQSRSVVGAAVGQSAQNGGLRILVIEGEDAVNIIQQKTAVAPVVEVRDRNDQPVAGALVTFSIRSGGANFGGAQTLTVTTNATGRATASGLTPTGAGASAGGGLSAATIGLIGGATAAGGTLVAVKASGNDDDSSSLVGNLQVVNSTNSVPWSGVPISNATCSGVANTWMFTTTFTETTGVSVTITATNNILDGAAVPEITGNLQVAARGSFTINRQFCFAQPTAHTLQSTFSGTDANGHAVSVVAPLVTLLAR